MPPTALAVFLLKAATHADQNHSNGGQVILRTVLSEGARLPTERPDPVASDAERNGSEPSGESRAATGDPDSVESERPGGLDSRGSRETSWRSRPRAMNLVEERGLFKAAHERRTAMRLQRHTAQGGLLARYEHGTRQHGSGHAPGVHRLPVQPHKRAEVLSAVDETVRRMRQASGCARSRLLADADDPNAFTVLSEWQSADTADTFFSSREFQIFKGIRILLRDEPVIVVRRSAGRASTRLVARTQSRARSIAAARCRASASGCAACWASGRAPARRPPAPFDPPPARRRAPARCAGARRRSASRSLRRRTVSSAGCQASLSVSVAPRDRMIARCSTFSSSRMLPGQSCAASASITSSGIAVDPLAQRAAESLDEVPHQQRNVVAPLAQRRQRDRKHVQPVEEIAAEPPLAHFFATDRDWSRR